VTLDGQLPHRLPRDFIISGRDSERVIQVCPDTRIFAKESVERLGQLALTRHAMIGGQRYSPGDLWKDGRSAPWVSNRPSVRIIREERIPKKTALI
jgi:hypothetical protein